MVVRLLWEQLDRVRFSAPRQIKLECPLWGILILFILGCCEVNFFTSQRESKAGTMLKIALGDF